MTPQAVKDNLSSYKSHKMIHLLDLSVMNIFWEFKETEKTSYGIDGCDHTIGFLSFWHIDLRCHTCMFYSEFLHEKCKKKKK